MAQSQIIFMNGKEEALTNLFTGDKSSFGWLAVGYKSEQNGFEDPVDDTTKQNGFQEITATGYQRVQLQKYTAEEPVKDTSTGKVTVKFTATLDTTNIQEAQTINQIAIVDRQQISEETKFYSATTFADFTKTQDSSITFIIGFRI